MLLLAVDTSGRQGGITLARGGDSQLEIVDSTGIEGGTFSAELIPQIAAVLRRHEFSARDLKALVAVTGPGSFTGLRVGLTAIKGLAETLQIPIATVTALEVLLAAAEQEHAIAVLDAGRGELYVSLEEDGRREELLMSESQALTLARERGLTVVADAVLSPRLPGTVPVTYSSSEVAARLGWKKLQAGETVDVLALDAHYIRRSEAEYMQKLRSRE